MKKYTWKYSDGSSTTREHSDLMDGDWRYGNNCDEVIFVINHTNPLYQESKSKGYNYDDMGRQEDYNQSKYGME